MTGAVALVIAPVMRQYGLDYLIATVILAGVLQIVLSVIGVARLMRFIPRSVMVGFVNALAILIFTAQIPHLLGVPWLVYPITVAVTVATHNLAYGVIAGVLTAMVAFAHRVAHFTEVEKIGEADVDHDGDIDTRVYKVRGELFFASSNDLVYQFDYVDDPRNIVIDMSDAHIWDASTVATLDAITTKYESKGKKVEIVGLDAASEQRHGRLSGHLAGH